MLLAALTVVFVILTVLFFKSLPKNDGFHRNITRLQARVISIIVLAALVCVAVAWVGTLKKSGVGKLFTDADSPQELYASLSEGNNSADIVIEGSRIIISGKRYDDIDKAYDELVKISEKGNDITLTDNYGRADTVLGVIEILRTYGVEIDTDDIIIHE
ncbi:MAG: hypothetical protein K6G12_03380 [Lachnospiraceae bacterium]|nr:hypothetical protein [Lachnospiraceae bacterium]